MFISRFDLSSELRDKLFEQLISRITFNDVIEMIKRKMVHVIVSTGANLVHDVLEVFGGVHYKGTPYISDRLLYEAGVDRVYDVFIPDQPDLSRTPACLIKEIIDAGLDLVGKAYGSTDEVFIYSRQVSCTNMGIKLKVGLRNQSCGHRSNTKKDVRSNFTWNLQIYV